MKRFFLGALFLLLVALGITAWLGLREDNTDATANTPANTADFVARGAYLARAGNCMGCHTARGGAEYAGGRAIQTPFGAIPAPNITPDRDTGIGSWSADDFWRALHNGKSKDGKLLYPAFPYPNYTRVTRADSDAMYAYFRTVAPVRQENREPELRFPFNHRVLLVGWRALYFRPGVHEDEPKQNAQWNRGAYLVQGLGHCSACHAPRNFLGATTGEENLSGAMIPMLNWYAASLSGDRGAGLGSWEVQHIVDLLKTGVSARGAASGPMAEVVRGSLQYLEEKDVRAMAVYLKSLPQNGETEASAPPRSTPQTEQFLRTGAELYEKHCVECHKADGRGEPPAYPALAGNRALTLASPVNPIRAVLHGGYPPSTQGNPQPYGMPPFSALLNDEEIAAVVSYVRNSWGNQGALVSGGQVNNYRAVTLD